MTALLTTRNLAVSIADIRICRGLNLVIESGSRWAILGRNGCGKTTLLKTLAGLHGQDTGEVLLNGEALGGIPRTQLARTLGIQFQEQTRLFPTAVLDAVLIGRHPHIGPWRWEGEDDVARARAALGQAGLAGMEGRDLSTLSGGELQRLAIAALLAQDPALYLLDEPSAHLDFFYQIRTLRLLRDLSHTAGKTLVMVLHDVNLAARFCDHALLLFGAETLTYGTTTEVLTEANLTRLYGHPITRLQTGQGIIFSPAWD